MAADDRPGDLIEVIRGTQLDLVRVITRHDTPRDRVTFVALDDAEPEVRVRWRRAVGWQCDDHGRPDPPCRHIASAAEAIDHQRREYA